METQRSFSVKSSKFLVFSLTISSSLISVTFVSVWLLKFTPPSRQATPHLQFNTGSLALTLNPFDAQKLTGFSGNISPEGSILVDTHLFEPGNTSENASGSSELTTLSEIQSDDEPELLEDEEGDIIGGAYGGDANSTSLINTISGPLSETEGDGASGGQENEGTDSTIISFEQIEVGKTKNGEVEERRERASALQQNAFLIREENGAKSSGGCDLTNGKWVYDESYPLYTNRSCPFIDEGFNCEGNGRTDKEYTKWRWQPCHCEIPRFNATNMLESIRGKRLVFVGDSINRNQWESMLCLLMGAVRDPKRVYETRGRKITKEKGNYCFRFVDYSCTVEFYVSHFLVHESKARVGKKRVQTLRIDTMDRGSSRWRRADILVFNTAHWWSHHKTKAGINYYQEGSQVHPQLDVSTAFRKALMTWASWVDKQIDPAKTQVFFRSSAPSHFRGGQWNSGGHCREATWPLNTSLSGYGHYWKNVIAEDVLRHMKTPVRMLNVTDLSEYRVDGHPSIYGGWSGKGRSSRTEDCSHWCLPGVPDTWNELLYMHLQSKQHDAL